jgi:Icc-related predicted phosphoesterase
MRIAYTSDLHIDTSPKNRAAARRTADIMASLRPDVIVLAGDAGNTVHSLEETLSFFRDLEIPKYFVAGNHDVWIEAQEEGVWSSREKYFKRIPHACRQMGFHDLGRSPVVLGKVGLVGSLGWYDYSLADPRLGLAEDEYWIGRFGDDQWWDKVLTFWDGWAQGGGRSACRLRDGEVCEELRSILRAHLADVNEAVDRIVGVIHTVPFEATLPRSEPPYYLDAFSGSAQIGNLLLANPKVTHCICGHKHESGDWKVGAIDVHRRILGHIAEDESIDDAARRAVGVLDL